MPMRFLLPAMMIASVLALAGPASSDEGSERALFNALGATEDAERADLLAAEIERQWREERGPTVKLLHEQADTLIAAGDLLGARAKLTGIVEFDPAGAEGFARRGQIHRDLRDTDAALNDLETAVDLEPRHFRALFLLAQIREQNGEWSQALEAYRTTAKLYPAWPEPEARIKALIPLVSVED